MKTAIPIRALFFLAVLCATATADIRFSITDLGTLGGASATPAAINNSGQIVGASTNANGVWRAFLYTGGAMNDLGVNGAAWDINDNGQIVVNSSLYSAGVFTPISFPAPATAFEVGGSSATAINNAGDVTGWRNYQTSSGDYETRAGLYSNGVSIDLGFDGFATDINDSGTVVGNTSSFAFRATVGGAVMYSGSGLTSLGISADYGPFGTPPRPTYAINASGQIAGSRSVTKSYGGLSNIYDWEYTAFLYSNGTPTYFTPAGTESRAWAINDAGRVVGDLWAWDGPQDPANPHSAFLYGYSQTQPLVDLNTLIDPASSWTLERAYDINDSNSIIGVGQHNGQSAAFLLTPLEPLASWHWPPLFGDVTGDGLVTDADRPAFVPSLVEYATGGPFRPELDCNHDGLINMNDLEAFLTILTNSPDVLKADVNLDGLANALDIQSFVQAINTGDSPAWAEADTNQDSVVNALDIQSFITLITGGAGQVVPEPSGMAFSLAGALALLPRRHRL